MGLFGRRIRIGLDWSGESVKVVRIMLSGGRARLTHFAAGEAKGEPRVAALVKQAGIHPRRAEIRGSLTEGELHLRRFDLPCRKETDLASTLPFEIRRHVPIDSGADPVLDYQILSRDSSSGRATLFAAVAHRAHVEGNREALARIGMTPGRLEPAPVAAMNHWLRLRPGADTEISRAILDVGGRASWLSIMSEGVPAYSRSMPVGGNAFTQEIAERCDLPRETAERVKRGEVALAKASPGVRRPNRPLAELVRLTAGRLADETRLHLDAFRKRNGPVREIGLGGGGALLHGLDLILERRLGMPVRLIDPFEPIELPDGWTEKSRDLLLEEAPRFLAAVGLTAWWEA